MPRERARKAVAERDALHDRRSWRQIASVGRAAAAAVVLVLTLGVLATPRPATANPASESRAVVEAQLEAFAAGDFVAAYSYAAPGIQSKFPSPAIFEQMVRMGYPMVIAPRVREHLDTASQGDMMVQRFRLVDARGAAYHALYYLLEIDGSWRIAAVQIEAAPGLSA